MIWSDQIATILSGNSWFVSLWTLPLGSGWCLFFFPRLLYVRRSEVHFSSFAWDEGFIVCVLNRNLWNFAGVPLQHAVSMASSYREELCVTEIWLRWIATIWSSNRSNDVYSSLTLRRLILRTKTGQTKRLLIEFLWSQLHRRDANSSGAFPRSSVPQYSSLNRSPNYFI